MSKLAFRLNFAAKHTFVLLAAAVIAITSLVFVLQVVYAQAHSKSQLAERAEDVALRVAINVESSVWDVYQKGAQRQYSELPSSAILDSELQADFVQSVQVFGNFGHLLMARSKADDGTFFSSSHLLQTKSLFEHSSRFRLPILQSSMTIGHIVVVYTDAFEQTELLLSYLFYGCFDLLFVCVLLSALWLLFKSSKAHRDAQQALVSLSAAQEKLVEAEKLASLGNLVTGLAHEINTPIGIAVTANSLIDELVERCNNAIKDEKLSLNMLNNMLTDLTEASQISQRSLDRAVELVTNFKMIASDQNVDDSRQINIYDYVHDVMSTLAVEIRRQHIKYQLIGDQDIVLETYPGVLAQIISNLVANSLKHAFAAGAQGEISVSVFKHANHQVKLIIKDNGMGMSEDVRAHIFEPFFTTKRGQGGTGLGMHIVYNLVQQKLNGQIELQTTEGHGSEFTIIWPALNSK